MYINFRTNVMFAIHSSNSSQKQGSSNTSRGARVKTSARGKGLSDGRSSRSSSVTSISGSVDDLYPPSQPATSVKAGRKPSSTATSYSNNKSSSSTSSQSSTAWLQRSQSKSGDTFNNRKKTSESKSSTGAIKKQYPIQQEVKLTNSGRRQRNGNNNNNNNVTIAGASVGVGASTAWEVNSDKNSQLDSASCKSFSTSASSYTRPGSSQSGKSIGRGRKRDLTADLTSVNQINNTGKFHCISLFSHFFLQHTFVNLLVIKGTHR